MKAILLTVIFCSLLHIYSTAQTSPRFRALVLYENGGHHLAYSKAAQPWLNKLAADSNFSIRYITQTDSIDEQFLRQFGLFIQLDYPPYAWKPAAVSAFQQYIEEGRGGWIGFHHATLLGEFDGYPVWNWFANWMGGIRFKNYIPGFADGTVYIEDTLHPCMKGIPPSFTIEKEEWYTYDKSPRGSVKVLASVNEASYRPDSDTKMGDHPVVWTNTRYPSRNIYIFMGHAPELFNNTAYTTIFRNAISWAAKKEAL